MVATRSPTSLLRSEIGTHASMDPLVNAMRGYVMAVGGEEIHGKQPRGVIERDIQRLLVKTKVWKEQRGEGEGSDAVMALSDR